VLANANDGHPERLPLRILEHQTIDPVVHRVGASAAAHRDAGPSFEGRWDWVGPQSSHLFQAGGFFDRRRTKTADEKSRR
jgi:hypothetical protein